MSATRITLGELEAGENDAIVFEAIKSAFGTPDSLGIIAIQLPSDHVYHAQRKHLLELAPRIASLPAEVKASLEHPQSNYSFGWSHGKEIMESGPDTGKGSYYAQINPRAPSELTAEFTAKYPSYGYPNVWPAAQQLGGESLEHAFLGLGRTMADIGVVLARRLDAYLKAKTLGRSDVASFSGALSSPTNCHKGRLLYYFPQTEAESDAVAAAWCGLHLDHSMLTVLTRAITDPSVLDPADKSGLYIQLPSDTQSQNLTNAGNKKDQSVKDEPRFVRVAIPEDCVAIQIGEAATYASNGLLRATPHLVKGSSRSNVARSTFACFLQPDSEFDLGAGKTFGAFSEEILALHYEQQ
ncbi:hypothetical protein HK100_010212 [Physocladia obscura]|uniref:Non-haem dioxygenase N-terminal domain-containing protein n=1 Tax=Physocladia obscura TaxID=109957 RepID=A0AAD5T2J3_9FUNG|nr:hypothetical protein HK100_010212 [Physocladia obscura]